MLIIGYVLADVYANCVVTFLILEIGQEFSRVWYAISRL